MLRLIKLNCLKTNHYIAFLAITLLLFSTKGFVLCAESNGNLIVEFNQEQCCYHIANQNDVNNSIQTGFIYSANSCTDYNISNIFTFRKILKKNKKVISIVFKLLASSDMLITNAFLQKKLSKNIFLLKFTHLSQKIISSIILII